jgi:pimeloyl-ACP methyl ester carboxylesterase
MSTTTVGTAAGDLAIAYEVVGEGGRPWIITPGGRVSKDYPGIREMAQAIADAGDQVVIWDRPNTGASDVVFERTPESLLQADALAGLLRTLDLGPAVLAGGSGGSRVSMLAAGRHPDVASGLAVWWISGGVLGLIGLGWHYCSESIRAAFYGGMEAVVSLPDWREVLERNPANRDRMLALDPAEFIGVLEEWMLAYWPGGDELVPGLTPEQQAALGVPTIVFRSGDVDLNHPRETSEQVAAGLPRARLVDPPWGEREWRDRQEARNRGEGSLFDRWHLLVPQLLEWADEVVPR